MYGCSVYITISISVTVDIFHYKKLERKEIKSSVIYNSSFVSAIRLQTPKVWGPICTYQTPVPSPVPRTLKVSGNDASIQMSNH